MSAFFLSRAVQVLLLLCMLSLSLTQEPPAATLEEKTGDVTAAEGTMTTEEFTIVENGNELEATITTISNFSTSEGITITPVGDETTPTTADIVPEEEWEGCIDRNFPDSLVTIGQRTTICLVLANKATWDLGVIYIRLSFQPSADEYSRFYIPDSYKDLVQFGDTLLGSNTDILLHVASQKALSFQKMYYKPSSSSGDGKVYPYLTAIIDVKDGVVQGIVWDDACIFCNRVFCEENTYDFNGNLGTSEQFNQKTASCHIPEEECNRYLVEDRTDCDLTLHVVWTGTDANGKALKTSEMRMSAFEAKDFKNRLLDDIPEFKLPEININD